MHKLVYKSSFLLTYLKYVVLIKSMLNCDSFFYILKVVILSFPSNKVALHRACTYRN